MKVFYVLMLTCLSFGMAQSQNLEVGLMLGGSYYSGDMDAPKYSTNLKNTKFAFGLFGRYHLSNKMAIRASLTFAKLRGADSLSVAQWQIDRNLSFENNITELSGTFEYNFFEFNPLNGIGSKFTPYVFAGLAYFRHNPTTLYLGQTIELQPLGTEGQGMLGYENKYSLNQLSIPFGGGIKYALTDKILLGFEINGRKTFTDHLDDLSGEYVNYDDLLNGNGFLSAQLSDRTQELTGEISDRATGSQRGKASVKDYYFTGMVTLSYRLESSFGFGGGGEMGCPTF